MTEATKENIEQQSLKEILTALCEHLGDIAHHLGELSSQAEVLNEKIDLVVGTYSQGEYGFIRTSQVD